MGTIPSRQDVRSCCDGNQNWDKNHRVYPLAVYGTNSRNLQLVNRFPLTEGCLLAARRRAGRKYRAPIKAIEAWMCSTPNETNQDNNTNVTRCVQITPCRFIFTVLFKQEYKMYLYVKGAHELDHPTIFRMTHQNTSHPVHIEPAIKDMIISDMQQIFVQEHKKRKRADQAANKTTEEPKQEEEVCDRC